MIFTNYAKLTTNLDPTCVLLPPHSKDKLPSPTLNRIVAALATKYKVHKSVARKYLPEVIHQYRKIRRVDSDSGDTMVASEAGTKSADRQDATFICVSLNKQ